ncbi:MAG: purine-nucleoside phosphorylase [Saprospiraceae bacterium]|nr:purine-nucleoside phosphorylase [Saprospiraceae bacterium]MDW8483966.1 purine-nucleoside phosphorylase [Saprospiraceae bacterium]
MGLFDNIQEAVDFIRHTVEFQPKTGIILGTGLGNLVEEVDTRASIPYSSIPHFACSTVESHRGELVLGHLESHPVVIMSGRLHYYEGWTMQQVTFPVRVLGALGIERLIITNASGGINPHLRSGDIVVVRDHINLLPENPLRGPNDERLGPRFPDMSQPYHPGLRRMALQIARECGIRAFEGIYSALQGPNLETPAEYAMLRRLGADCTGMSSVPEVLVARHQRIPVLMLSLVTNVAFPPDVIRETTVEEVIALAQEAQPRLTLLLRKILCSLEEAKPSS